MNNGSSYFYAQAEMEKLWPIDETYFKKNNYFMSKEDAEKVIKGFELILKPTK